MTLAERRAYTRGYYAGLHRRWPEYKPPLPPHAQTAAVMKAAQEMSDAVSTWVGAFGPDDEFSIEMRKRIVSLDTAFAAVTSWLKVEQLDSTVQP